tara:strand:+ start:669 stop:980 length:312 start_codon:yes stop_codon:yes gene_type:complete
MSKQKIKTISINITEADYQILCHELPDPQTWVENALAGKINNIKKRLIPKAVQELIADPAVESIPASNDEICNQFFSKPGYKNAKVHKEEEDADFKRMLDEEK